MASSRVKQAASELGKLCTHSAESGIKSKTKLFWGVVGGAQRGLWDLSSLSGDSGEKSMYFSVPYYVYHMFRRNNTVKGQNASYIVILYSY